MYRPEKNERGSFEANFLKIKHHFSNIVMNNKEQINIYFILFTLNFLISLFCIILFISLCNFNF